MQYYKTPHGTYIKGNHYHVLEFNTDGVVDNSGEIPLDWYKQELNVKPISREEFDTAFKKVVEGINQFNTL